MYMCVLTVPKCLSHACHVTCSSLQCCSVYTYHIAAIFTSKGHTVKYIHDLLRDRCKTERWSTMKHCYRAGVLGVHANTDHQGSVLRVTFPLPVAASMLV